MRAHVPDSVWGTAPDASRAEYMDDSGTSMAAPHVSGAMAAFLSVHPEYVGMPDDVKQIFCDTAISLGRDTYFEGHGLIDVLAAIASV